MRMISQVGLWVAAITLLTGSPAFAAGSSGVSAPVSQGTEDHAAHTESGSAGMEQKRGGDPNGAQGAWTAFPTLKIRMSRADSGRRMVTVVPQGLEVDHIDAYSSEVDSAAWHSQLVFDLAGAKLMKQPIGGFYWLAGREEQGDRVQVASTVHYSTERGAQNPTAMFMRQKHELEIIPQPYPREHSRYRANESWKFMVRFNGKPLAGQKVHIETANGTRAELASDAQGMVTLAIPADFSDENRKSGGHDHGRRSADFVLATEHVVDGRNYLTAFNASYGPGAFDQRSLALGLGFTLLGMIGAAPLLRQRKAVKPESAHTGNDKEA